MTSVVSRDDVEAELWRAGVKSWPEIARLLKVIDVYSISRGRDFQPGFGQIEPVEPWGHLGPGGWDKESRVTRCEVCHLVKSWRGNFRRNQDHPSRWHSTCKLCEKTVVISPSIPEGKLYLCRGCDTKKEIGLFPLAKRQNPSRNYWCLRCSHERVENLSDCRTCA